MRGGIVMGREVRAGDTGQVPQELWHQVKELGACGMKAQGKNEQLAG